MTSTTSARLFSALTVKSALRRRTTSRLANIPANVGLDLEDTAPALVDALLLRLISSQTVRRRRLIEIDMMSPATRHFQALCSLGDIDMCAQYGIRDDGIHILATVEHHHQIDVETLQRSRFLHQHLNDAVAYGWQYVVEQVLLGVIQQFGQIRTLLAVAGTARTVLLACVPPLPPSQRFRFDHGFHLCAHHLIQADDDVINERTNLVLALTLNDGVKALACLVTHDRLETGIRNL